MPPEEQPVATASDAEGRSGYDVYAGLVPLAMAPLGVAVILDEAGLLVELATPAQWVVVSLAFASTLYILGLFAFPAPRRRWVRWNSRWGPVLPVVNTVGMAFYATCGFALATGFLYLEGLAVASPDELGGHPFNEVYAYYMWNFLDAVPYLEIPRTIGWDVDLVFVDHLSPVLLLFYKLALVGPVIAIGQLVWRDVRALRETWRQHRAQHRERHQQRQQQRRPDAAGPA